MKHLYEKFTSFALQRAAVFGVMSIVTLLFSEFLRGAIFYVIVGYVFLCGILGIAEFVSFSKETNVSDRYGVIAASVLMIGFGVLSIVYGRYLVHVAPLYLGGLMFVQGFVYFIAAVFVKKNLQWLQILLSFFVLIGSGAIVIFTFGFEIVLTLAQISSITLLLSCIYELTTYFICHKSVRNQMEGKKIL